MSQKNTGFEIRADQRQSWQSIALVWAGGMICVPCLMIGGVLVGGGLSFAQIVLSILLGYGMICAYMIFIGMQACDTGLPVSVMASGALGERVRVTLFRRFLPSPALAGSAFSPLFAAAPLLPWAQACWVMKRQAPLRLRSAPSFGVRSC